MIGDLVALVELLLVLALVSAGVVAFLVARRRAQPPAPAGDETPEPEWTDTHNPWGQR